MIWHIIDTALLLYVARKLQQGNRRHRLPWWVEIADAINRIRPGTF